MKNIADFLELFMDKTGYPEDAKDTFRNIHAQLLRTPAAAEKFDGILAGMENGGRKELLVEAVFGRPPLLHGAVRFHGTCPAFA